MPFNQKQQAEYRPVVDRAWKLHCQKTGCDLKDKAAKREWYEDILEEKTGLRSSTQCNGGRHYDRVAARFEELAEDDIKFGLALLTGDLERIKYAVTKQNSSYLDRFKSDQSFESYLKGLAVRQFRLDKPSALHDLTDDQIGQLTRSVCIDARRDKQK
jgi:hypothetical protein